MKNNTQNWPIAIRVIHLKGGGRAINNAGPSVIVHPQTIDRKELKLQLKTYGSIYSNLEVLGFDIIGTDFYAHVSETEGNAPPQWKPFHRQDETVWPTTEVTRLWRQIAHASFKRKKGFLWDISSRIAHQLRVVAWRLREISEIYRIQLRSRINRGDYEEGIMFEDRNTWFIYNALQTFLVDACILRDYIAEFAGNVIFSNRYNLKTQAITGISGLIKNVLDKVPEPDALINQFKVATDNGGWIKTLGDYRNLIIHSAPLAYAEKKLFAICDSFNIEQNKKFPAIRCPIPDDPGNIKKSRAKGIHFENFSDQFDKFSKAARGEIPSLDGVEYAHMILKNLVDLSKSLSKESPIKPEKIVIDKLDIIDSIKREHSKRGRKTKGRNTILESNFLIYFTPDGGVYYTQSADAAEMYFEEVCYPATRDQIKEYLGQNEGKAMSAVFVGLKSVDEIETEKLITVAEELYQHPNE